MTHPSDQELLALEDGELTARPVRDLLGHLAECTSCAARRDEVRGNALRTSALLAAIDHRRPSVSVDAVIARARMSTGVQWRPLVAAGVAVIMLASAATAAVPGTALHRYLARVFAVSPAPLPRRAPTAPVAAPATRHLGASGIAFVPASTVEVVFRDGQTAGAIRITLRDSQFVRLEHYGGNAGYALTATGVVVENAGSRASYVLMLPRAGRHVVVRVGNRIVFARTNDHIATAAARDSSGSYVLAFTHLSGREP